MVRRQKQAALIQSSSTTKLLLDEVECHTATLVDVGEVGTSRNRSCALTRWGEKNKTIKVMYPDRWW